ncbi:MAG TPA: tyrosine-type recombinase/integrase, partial [Thermoanaerobaculia bacterium]|nr:tyrosine-type recombinase/integrase [Thermoanaerobaculia bacterium]
MAVALAPAPPRAFEDPLPEALEAVPWRLAVAPAARLRRLRPPRVLTREEVRRLIGRLGGTPRLAARLVYASGLRAEEIVRLRAGDVDLAGLAVTVRGRRGAPDRRAPLPPTALAGLERLLAVA